ncbi:MAG: PIN domain-containing protein [Mycobacterium sp.]|uniref:PIN domain-containing protein n=1 Tax=Mycobacterium sp. TaxID=1785 RepID=UPI003F9B4FFC
MKIHIDTNLLIQQPRWERLPAGDYELFVSAIAFAEFSEGTAHPDPQVAARARLDLIQLRNAYGDGLPFAQREADVYRELCATVTTAGRMPGGRRRVDLMIAAVAVADGAALATRNTGDFDGLEPALEVIAL